jgi:geranylgeranylglycerol-phosphate geranylgeranyltransferase
MSSWIEDKVVLAHDMFKLEDQAANVLSFVLGALLATGSIPPFSVSFLCAFVAVFCSLLGVNLLNQITDIEIDRINKPHRPLPSGKISKKAAIIITAILYAIAGVAAAVVSVPAFALTAVYLIMGLLYSLPPARLKERFILSNISIAICYNFVNFLMGWVVFKPLGAAPLPLLALLFAYDVIAINAKDYFDVEGDRLHNARTLPVLLGTKKALDVDEISNLAILSVFIALGFSGVIPIYISVLGILMLIGTGIIFQDVKKNSDFLRFYHLSFSMHIIARLIILAMFFSGFVR